MSIPFVDLKAQFRRLEREIRERIDVVLEHGRFIMGPEVCELEEALARFVGVEHAIGCSSGTDALLLPLMANGVGPGDAVLTTPFTFIATAEVIALLGATPVFVDIEPDTFNLDPEKLAEAVPKIGRTTALRPRAVIAVDLFGLPADYDAIEPICATHGLLLIEDAAQSFGAVHNGRRAGRLGHVAATSFFPAKPLGGYGDGGAVLTDDDRMFAEMVSIRVHGQGRDRYDNVRIGLNARLDTLQAAILLPKLGVLPDELEARQQVADRYTAGLEGLVQTPRVPQGRGSAWAQYSILSSRRDRIREALAAEGIPTAIYYPRPLHLQPAFAHLGYRAGEFPVCEQAAQRILSLPMHPYLGEEQVDRIVDAIRRALQP